jgi:hypothetical protein
MAPTDTIERLVSFQGRWPGTDSERHAAEYLAGELQGLGRQAEIEPIRVRPAYHLTHALHAALGVIGSVVSVNVPPLGVAILLLAAVSMYGDLTARFYLLRLLMPRRRSQNVTSPGSRAEAPARVVLTAHYDAARSGLMFARRRKPAPRPLRLLARLAGPIDVVFWAITVALILAVARLLLDVSPGESTLLTAAQFAPTVVLLIAILLLVDVALSEVVPGASDNASGVAAALELARRLATVSLQHIDLWVVFTGAKEGLTLGMREWMRAHQDELDPRRTFFINLDNVGAGRVRFVRAEGLVVLSQHDGRLVELGRSIAEARNGDLAGESRIEPTPYVWRLATDGVIPLMRGFSSITVCCTDEYGRIPNFHRHSDTPGEIEPEAVEAAISFVEELVQRIDEQVVPSLVPSLASETPPAVPSKAEQAPPGSPGTGQP